MSANGVSPSSSSASMIDPICSASTGIIVAKSPVLIQSRLARHASGDRVTSDTAEDHTPGPSSSGDDEDDEAEDDKEHSAREGNDAGDDEGEDEGKSTKPDVGDESNDEKDDNNGDNDDEDDNSDDHDSGGDVGGGAAVPEKLQVRSRSVCAR